MNRSAPRTCSDGDSSIDALDDIRVEEREETFEVTGTRGCSTPQSCGGTLICQQRVWGLHLGPGCGTEVCPVESIKAHRNSTCRRIRASTGGRAALSDCGFGHINAGWRVYDMTDHERNGDR